MHNICVCIADFADDARVVRQSRALVSLYLRGRHIKCTTITSTQVWRALHPHIRKNALSLIILRLRNQTEIEALADELGALHPDGKKGILALYREATDEEYSYLYVDLPAKRPADMFYRKWKKMSLRNESVSHEKGFDGAVENGGRRLGYPRQTKALRNR